MENLPFTAKKHLPPSVTPPCHHRVSGKNALGNKLGISADVRERCRFRRYRLGRRSTADRPGRKGEELLGAGCHGLAIQCHGPRKLAKMFKATQATASRRFLARKPVLRKQTDHGPHPFSGLVTEVPISLQVLLLPKVPQKPDDLLHHGPRRVLHGLRVRSSLAKP